MKRFRQQSKQSKDCCIVALELKRIVQRKVKAKFMFRIS